MQKQRSDISLVQNEQASSLSSLLYGFNEIQLTSTKVENNRLSSNSVVISYSISSPISLHMVIFLFLIVHNTFSLHILSKILIFIQHKQGFLKFPLGAGNMGNT